jgi:AraC-like DNA-binding protein
VDARSLFSFCPRLSAVGIHSWPHGVGSYIDPVHVFTYIPSGSGVFRLGSASYDVSPGDAILMPPHLLHVIRSNEGEPLVQWVVVGQFTVPYDGKWPLPLVVRVASADRERMAACFGELHDTWQSDPTVAGGIQAASLAMQLLALYLRNCESGVPLRQEDTPCWRQVERAIGFIHDEFARNLTVADIATVAELSASYLTRFFRRYTGMTPYNYLNRVRVSQAQSLLLRGGLTCSEVAARTGFGDAQTFSKVFRRHEGCAPRQWLADARGGV